MLPHDTRLQIENILSGNVITGNRDHCTAIRNHFSQRDGAGRTVKADFKANEWIKERQAAYLNQYATQHNCWIPPGDFGREFSYGGEARVYLAPGKRTVIKTNDGRYYATWQQYFTSILLHNALFPSTAYTLLGFAIVPNFNKETVIHAVLQQPYIVSDRLVELDEVRTFIEHNDFVNVKDQDYRHVGLKLKLEDLHDENVLVQNDVLFFIDTVFYFGGPEL